MGQEEIFGPIALIMRYSTLDEAIEIANGTEYGLTAAILTQDEAQAWHIAQRLEAGMIFVNNYMRRSFLGSPFGGQKGSGFGRENAPETLTSSCGRRRTVPLRPGRDSGVAATSVSPRQPHAVKKWVSPSERRPRR